MNYMVYASIKLIFKIEARRRQTFHKHILHSLQTCKKLQATKMFISRNMVTVYLLNGIFY